MHYQIMIYRESGPNLSFTLPLYLIQATAPWYLPDRRISSRATLKTLPVTSHNMSLLLADKFLSPRTNLLSESSYFFYCTVRQALVYCNL